jgi:hypothetical protein
MSKQAINLAKGDFICVTNLYYRSAEAVAVDVNNLNELIDAGRLAELPIDEFVTWQKEHEFYAIAYLGSGK